MIAPIRDSSLPGLALLLALSLAGCGESPAPAPVPAAGEPAVSPGHGALVAADGTTAGEDRFAGIGPDVARPADHVDLTTRTPVFTEEDVSRLFIGVRTGKRQRYDPLAMATLIPDLELSYPWPEHAGGRVVVKTNNLGFRRDTDTQLEKRGLRVLVCGDSQTDGIVENDESFVTRLEERLRAAGAGASTDSPAGAPAVAPAREVECLNAGVGGMGPHGYLGMLRARLPLRPDVCVAMLYAGNDFTDTAFLEGQLAGSAPTGKREYFAPLDAAFKRWNTSLVGNSFNQALAFKHRPDDARRGFAEVVAVFEDMAALCRREGIVFLAGAIPTKPEIDRDDDATVTEVLEALSMAPADMEINTRLREAFVGALRARDIPCFDATVALRASPVPCYWKKDHHLNVAGNAVVAAELERALLPLLPSPR